MLLHTYWQTNAASSVLDGICEKRTAMCVLELVKDVDHTGNRCINWLGFDVEVAPIFCRGKAWPGQTGPSIVRQWEQAHAWAGRNAGGSHQTNVESIFHTWTVILEYLYSGFLLSREYNMLLPQFGVWTLTRHDSCQSLARKTKWDMSYPQAQVTAKDETTP